MNKTLLFLLFAPAFAFAQKKDTDNVYGTTQTWEKKAHAAHKIGLGGGLIAAGTVLTAGAAIHSVNITKTSEKTVVYAAAGAGAAIAIVGGIFLSSGAKSVSRYLSSKRIKFTGSSVAYTF